MVGASELVKRSSSIHVIGVLPLGGIVLVDRHHVLEVVPSRRKVRPLSNPAAILLNKDFLVLRNETFLWLVVEAAENLALEAFGCVV